MHYTLLNDLLLGFEIALICVAISLFSKPHVIDQTLYVAIISCCQYDLPTTVNRLAGSSSPLGFAAI